MRRFLTACSFAAIIWRQSVSAAELPSNWQHFQTLRFEQSGLIQFDLPIETLDAAQPDLRDVRLFDDNGREVPFALERTSPEMPTPKAPASFKSTLSGGSTVVTITTGLSQPLSGVVLETPARQFIKAVRIEGSRDGQAWWRIAKGEPFFKQFGVSRTLLPLDEKDWPQLRLTIDNLRTPPIAITGAQLHPIPTERAPDFPINTTIVDREEAGQQTRLTLRLAVANATISGITIRSPEPLFTRAASLVLRQVNENEVTESVLARDTLFRVAANGGAPAEDLTLDAGVVVPSREVLLVISNGDSPPLNISGVSAAGRPVRVTFHAGEGRTFHLLSGNPVATAPHYDVAALRGQLKPTLATPESRQPLAANASWRAPEALPNISLVGTVIDLAKWHFRKPITLAAAGVQQLELDLDVLAGAARTFADLRLVRDGRQLPYLIDRTPIQRKFTPIVTSATDPKRPTTSFWELKLPRRGLPLSRMECTTTATLFQRSARITEELRDDRGDSYRVTLGSAEWVRTPDRSRSHLVIQLTQTPRTDQIRLEVENGDNPALDLTEFTCWHPATRLLFKTDVTAETFLYYGNPAAQPARYDLSLVARQILAAEKIKASLGAEVALKKLPKAWDDSGGAGNWLFWTVLAGVVLALLIVLAKLLPKPPGN